MKACERCEFTHPKDSYDLLDYCAVCSKDLCELCLAAGCCGRVPAKTEGDDDNED